MRFVVDANLSPRVADRLNAAGHDAVAVRDVGLRDATDDEILDRALTDDRVIISTTPTSAPAVRRQTEPSFILVRSADPLTADQVADLIIANLDVMTEDLTAGAIVTFARGHLRSRRLPVK